MFVNKSTSHLINVFYAITKVSKEGKIVVEYMQAIKNILDDLVMVEHPLSDGEIVVHTLNRLTLEFKELFAIIRTCDTVPSFEEIHDKLLDHDPFF